MSESAWPIKTNSGVSICQEIQRTNSILTQSSPKVAIADLKIMTFNSPAIEYAQLHLPMSQMHCPLFTPSFLKNKKEDQRRRINNINKAGWICAVFFLMTLLIHGYSHFWKLFSFLFLTGNILCMSLEDTVRELLNTELWLGIYANQSENWKNRDYINFGEKNYFHGRMHVPSFIWGIMCFLLPGHFQTFL